MKTKEQENLRFMNSEIRYVERSSKSKERKKVMRRMTENNALQYLAVLYEKAIVLWKRNFVRSDV